MEFTPENDAETELIDLYEQAHYLMTKRDMALLHLNVEAAWDYDLQIGELLETLEAYEQIASREAVRDGMKRKH